MSIIRTYHNTENPFVQLNKQALMNPKLSWEAKGLWAMCLSRPDNWVFRVNELIKNGAAGKDKIYRIINELIDNGYAIRILHKDSQKKHFTHTEYVFVEVMISDTEKKNITSNFQKMFPRPENPEAANPDPENATLLITKYKDKDIKETNKRCPNSLKVTEAEADNAYYVVNVVFLS